jgi:DNA-binding FadR family transcriptional regulator
MRILQENLRYPHFFGKKRVNEMNQTRVEKSAEDIRQYIKDHNMVPGDKLPTEMELSKLLGVGRNTVREALRLLLSQNLITIRQGAGSFVSEKKGIVDDPFGFSMVDDKSKLTEDLLQVRIMIEPQIASLAAQNRTEEELKKVEEALLRVEEAIRQKRDFSVEDSDFHASIAMCTHNGVMAELIPVITRGVSTFSSKVKAREYEKTLITHRNVYVAIRDQKPNEAFQAMNYHLLYNINRFMQE